MFTICFGSPHSRWRQTRQGSIEFRAATLTCPLELCTVVRAYTQDMEGLTTAKLAKEGGVNVETSATASYQMPLEHLPVIVNSLLITSPGSALFATHRNWDSRYGKSKNYWPFA